MSCFSLSENLICGGDDSSLSPAAGGEDLEAESTPSTGDTETPSVFAETGESGSGWRVVQIDLMACTRSAFDQSFAELASMTVHSNVRLKTICLLEGLPVSEEKMLATLGISHWPNGAERAPLISLPSERRQEGSLAFSEPTQSSSSTTHSASSFAFTPPSSDPLRHESDNEILRPRHSRADGRSWPSPPPPRSRSCAAHLDLSEPLPLLVSPRDDSADAENVSFRPSLPPVRFILQETETLSRHRQTRRRCQHPSMIN